MPQRFSERVLAWWRRHGRKDLPWQREPTPYRVWVSEIMLQQTQVGTVVGYFDRFMARFPDLEALATAPVDEVLGLWSGLGYYARARNLHRAAQEAHVLHGGLPADLEALAALPGIGRSTAGAILALGHGRPASILDGNVKRVLARHAGIDGWPGETAVLHRLWALAEERTPEHEAGPYAQAMMDLGATLCTRANPCCGDCPVAADCVAQREGRQRELPAPKPRKTTPERETWMLLLYDAAGAVLLERRPPSGIWGGLWSLPEAASADEADARARELAGRTPATWQALPPFRHAFTHFRLRIHPLAGRLHGPAAVGVKDTAQVWYKPGQPPPGGIPAPVASLLEQPARAAATNDREDISQ
ncbi:A/G-specific adenine glycosylase [Acidihalobacter aeolianus]|uniref:Adenine DNA glycosylase n=1 Tax=Acidihalobacter aeolianus TaxID=2792603 RepID=A0A1D8K426_9GAMM|nr:A/G-specific adenine glycosylase [Acidihalobacter aeolianus]AOV15709.1 A/G-specific adenine glycosylase [Acidihalobacter aeolianus]